MARLTKLKGEPFADEYKSQVGCGAARAAARKRRREAKKARKSAMVVDETEESVLAGGPRRRAQPGAWLVRRRVSLASSCTPKCEPSDSRVGSVRVPA